MSINRPVFAYMDSDRYINIQRLLDALVGETRKAAEQDYVAAQRSLGHCYYEGDGVKKNHEEAARRSREA